MKIFLDANIFVAAAGSATGASRYLWRVAEREAAWQLLTCDKLVLVTTPGELLPGRKDDTIIAPLRRDLKLMPQKMAADLFTRISVIIPGPLEHIAAVGPRLAPVQHREDFELAATDGGFQQVGVSHVSHVSSPFP